MALTQHDLMGRQNIGEEETPVGRCQGGSNMLESPRPLSSSPGGNVGSGKGAVVLSQGYCHLWGHLVVCVLLYALFIAPISCYLQLEGRGLTYIIAR